MIKLFLKFLSDRFLWKLKQHAEAEIGHRNKKKEREIEELATVQMKDFLAKKPANYLENIQKETVSSLVPINAYSELELKAKEYYKKNYREVRPREKEFHEKSKNI